MSLIERFKKTSTIKETAILDESKFFNKKDMIQTEVPAINVALSGDFDGGFEPGLTVWAGPSKHFKTSYLLLMMKSYLDKYKDAIVLFYDSEFGTPQAYFKSAGIDMSRVLHTPITDIEEFKFDVMAQLNEIKRGDKVFIAVDSIGNMASKKEVDDAIEGKSVGDMTRAKQLKSVFRMVTPHLKLKDIKMDVVNHTYQTQEMYSKAVVSGGTGIYYSADNIYIIGRQQEKDGTEIVGWNFVINVEKSRYVREKSKIIINVMYGKGINRWSGLLEMAMDYGIIKKPKNGYYQQVDMATGEFVGKIYHGENATNVAELWEPILKYEGFKAWVRETYQISHGELLEKEMEEDLASVEEAVFLDDADFQPGRPKE